MALVQVTVKNNSGHTVGLTLDDEQDAERIAYLRTLVKREDLDSIKVNPVKGAPRGRGKAAAAAGAEAADGDGDSGDDA